jgi:glycosyltransferase involved in cell wall biosynthesis
VGNRGRLEKVVPVTNKQEKIMSDSPKFTIVLVGYQSEPYLPAALESISKQTFTDFEAICFVEDSTDKSLEICQAMADRDSRFSVVTGPKSGAASTSRNYGIDHAKGEYLVFIDGDDWVSTEMLEKLLKKLQATGPVDVLAFNAISTENDYVDWRQEQKITNFSKKDAEGVFSGFEAIRRIGSYGGSINNYTWLNAYRVAFLREQQLYQKPGLLMEDMEYMPRICFAAKTFAFLDESLYVYHRRPNSMMTQASSRIVGDMAHQVLSLISFVKNHQVPQDIQKIWSNQWLSVFLWLMFHPVSSNKIPDVDRKQALNIILENDGREGFKRMFACASMPKRLSLPLVMLAAKGIQFPAKVYFRQLYYPLVEHRR